MARRMAEGCPWLVTALVLPGPAGQPEPRSVRTGSRPGGTRSGELDSVVVATDDRQGCGYRRRGLADRLSPRILIEDLAVWLGVTLGLPAAVAATIAAVLGWLFRPRPGLHVSVSHTGAEEAE